MGFHLQLIFALLSVEVMALASHAAVPVPQLYWNSVLPNTQMPIPIRELLRPDSIKEDKSPSFAVGKPNGDILISYHGPPPSSTGHSGKPAFVGQSQLRVPFIYRKYAEGTENHQLLEDSNAAALFFLEKNLHPGTTVNTRFTKNTNTATFLPRKTADSIPFSSNKLQEILNHFSLKPSSVEANTIKQTIEECEAPGIKGEEKYCATSLESMIDFTTSKLGMNVQALISTEDGKGATMSMNKYTVMPGVKKLAGNNAVVCHKQNYPYAVFYCHAIKPTRSYIVPLVGTADGVRAKAVAVCHVDTSEWNPKHLAFQVLKVKPGTIPICHFLPNDHIVWVPKSP